MRIPRLSNPGAPLCTGESQPFKIKNRLGSNPGISRLLPRKVGIALTRRSCRQEGQIHVPSLQPPLVRLRCSALRRVRGTPVGKSRGISVTIVVKTYRFERESKARQETADSTHRKQRTRNAAGAFPSKAARGAGTAPPVFRRRPAASRRAPMGWLVSL